MSAPMPMELRARFISLLNEGLSGRAAALQLKLSPATGSRWGQSYRTTGRVDPALQGRPTGSGKLAPYHEFFREVIAQDGDITLGELRDALFDAHGVTVHISSIDALLRRLGFRFKKIAGGHRTATGRCTAQTPKMAERANADNASATAPDCVY